MSQQNKNKQSDKNKQLILMSLIVLLLVIAIFAVYMLTSKKDEENPKEIAYTDLIQEVVEGNIEKVEMTKGENREWK